MWTPRPWSPLRALGCDDVQGYLIARPMPGAEVPAYLARRPEVVF